MNIQQREAVKLKAINYPERLGCTKCNEDSGFKIERNGDVVCDVCLDKKGSIKPHETTGLIR